MPEKKYITYHRSLIKSVSRTQISTNTITGSKVTKTTKNIYISNKELIKYSPHLILLWVK
jgi:hypothetical protein